MSGKGHYTISPDDLRSASRRLREAALMLSWVEEEAPIVMLNHWANKLAERALEAEKQLKEGA